MQGVVHFRQLIRLILLLCYLGQARAIVFQGLIERLDVVVASLEEIAIGGIAIGIDILEENGAAVFQAATHHC